MDSPLPIQISALKGYVIMHYDFCSFDEVGLASLRGDRIVIPACPESFLFFNG
jgi:hypothetical protein